MITLQEAYTQILEGRHLSAEQAAALMGQVMEGAVTPAQLGFLLGLLRMKGETAQEVAGFALAMRQRAVKVNCASPLLVDTCGTGGDQLKTFNLSTASAFVVAAAGVKVAKHGNRSVSSKCGSADVLEALGANLQTTPEQVARCIDEVGVGFLFAPQHHPALKHAAAPRREIGMRTFFNLIGPMTNPAGATRQFMGVYEPKLTRLAAEVLRELGCEKALVAHGLDGLDEFSPLGPTRVVILENGELREQTFEPEAFGVKRVRLAEIAAGESPAENAALLRESLAPQPSPRSESILLNAAAALWVADAVSTLEEGVQRAREAQETGAAQRKLEEFLAATQEAKP